LHAAKVGLKPTLELSILWVEILVCQRY